MKKYNDHVVRKLQSVGIITFVKYYYVFKKHIYEIHNDLIFEEFSKNNEKWNSNSCKTKASQGKKIFINKFEKEVLEIIINTANANKIGQKTIEDARSIYLKEF